MRADIWIWLPGHVDPVHCGRLRAAEDSCAFRYEESYMARPGAIALSPLELPLVDGWQRPEGLIAGCLRDAAPDYWGRRVLAERQTAEGFPGAALEELDTLVSIAGNRIGGLEVLPEGSAPSAGLPEADLVETLERLARFSAGGRLHPAELAEILSHVGVGGARPKAIGLVAGRPSLLKIASPLDPHPIVAGEALGMALGRKLGLKVAGSRLLPVGDRQVLCIDRFDREPSANGWQRRLLLSGLSLQGLREEEARYASYAGLAAVLRQHAGSEARARAMLTELYRRMVFNILIGNTDDHARNHAAFWDGQSLDLTPAYDLDPRPRLGREANQAMSVHGVSRQSRLALALVAAPDFGICAADAEQLVIEMIEGMHRAMPEAIEEAGLSREDADRLAGRALLNPYIFEGAPAPLARLERPLVLG